MTGAPTDVVVIGAGLIGSSIARRIADDGRSVTVIDAGRPAGGASFGTFAWVNAVGKRPRGYFDLNVAGMAEHRRLVDELGEGEWFHAGGNLEWSTAAEALEAKVADHRGLGYPVELLEPSRVAELEPDVALPDDAVAVLYPDDAWIDPAPLVRRLLDHPRLTLRAPVEVVDLMTEGARVTALRLADGTTIAAEQVVIAAGPRSGELVARLGFDLPMRRAPGVMALTQPAAVRVTRVLHAPGLAIRPDGAGRLMLASDDVDRRIQPSGGTLTVTDAASELLRRAVEVIPRLAGTGVEAVRIGLRALTGDGLPALGTVPETEGAYLAVTHSGVTLAPLIGRLVARELSGRVEAVLDGYRPTRFLGVGGES